MKRFISLFVCASLAVLTMSCAHTSVKSMQPEPYRVAALDEISSAAEFVDKNCVFAIGMFEDKTGKFTEVDAGQSYSRAMTQAGRDLLTNFLWRAGFTVVDRDPYNFSLIGQEYALSHNFQRDKDGKVIGQIGLIQNGGPTKGLTGATYIVTGAITTYQVDRFSGGGGVEIDGFGAQVKYVRAVVAVHLRIVDLNTSKVVASSLIIVKVEGKRIGVNAFKLVTNNGRVMVVSAEAGLASQFPADFAFSEALIQALAQVLTTPGTNFYTKKVNFGDAQPAKIAISVAKTPEKVVETKPPEKVAKVKPVKAGLTAQEMSLIDAALEKGRQMVEDGKDFLNETKEEVLTSMSQVAREAVPAFLRARKE